MEKTGTKVTFKPDASIFQETIVFDFDILKTRLREMAFLTKGLRIILRDARIEEDKSKENEAADPGRSAYRRLSDFFYGRRGGPGCLQ